MPVKYSDAKKGWYPLLQNFGCRVFRMTDGIGELSDVLRCANSENIKKFENLRRSLLRIPDLLELPKLLLAMHSII